MRSLLDTSPEAIDVTCVSGGCTSSAGSMDTVVTLAGGRQLHANPLTWGNGGGPVLPPGVPGMPQLPVAPTCLGVPEEMCRQMAGSDFPDAALHGGVVKIVVSCTKEPCTSSEGRRDHRHHVRRRDGGQQQRLGIRERVRGLTSGRHRPV